MSAAGTTPKTSQHKWTKSCKHYIPANKVSKSIKATKRISLLNTGILQHIHITEFKLIIIISHLSTSTFKKIVFVDYITNIIKPIANEKGGVSATHAAFRIRLNWDEKLKEKYT